mmetsp:Transcript_4683/g.7782  ORF Transcript_4683/g.7782 Transcript_4683/m.7782 type:complete len:174 (-) Transcript_4683:181-702(-)|eukprot:CAMPEP_0202699130 /NCGR_PEP_ID=MMETSP1385-20130828/12346_1 /ASSEMBLY_ACC=CAM_ASM_000861 /TAXON_ID=933848 /ORGANISM="Elphidium margaritaceum" /LENGTH=173 /DNA_ID=CAMNT_0049355991 /DNA_START=90 /DNA_END=611 /DNA_ORIENTATION=+
MATNNVSDAVVFSITRKHNARRRSHCTYGRRNTVFTRESGNLLQLDTRRTTGYAEQTVGVGQLKGKSGQPPQLTLVMKKRKKIRKPSELRVEATIEVDGKLKVKKQVEAQTKFRLYRGDLARLAQRRLWKIRQTRSDYKRFLRREAKIQKEDDEEDNDEDGDKKQPDELVDVD